MLHKSRRNRGSAHTQCPYFTVITSPYVASNNTGIFAGRQIHRGSPMRRRRRPSPPAAHRPSHTGRATPPKTVECALCARVYALVRTFMCVRVCVSVRLCVRVSVCASMRPYVRPPVRPSPSVRLCVHPSVRACVRPSVRPSVHPSVRACVRAPVRLPACKRVHACVCLCPWPLAWRGTPSCRVSRPTPRALSSRGSTWFPRARIFFDVHPSQSLPTARATEFRTVGLGASTSLWPIGGPLACSGVRAQKWEHPRATRSAGCRMCPGRHAAAGPQRTSLKTTHARTQLHTRTRARMHARMHTHTHARTHTRTQILI